MTSITCKGNSFNAGILDKLYAVQCWKAPKKYIFKLWIKILNIIVNKPEPQETLNLQGLKTLWPIIHKMIIEMKQNDIFKNWKNIIKTMQIYKLLKSMDHIFKS